MDIAWAAMNLAKLYMRIESKIILISMYSSFSETTICQWLLVGAGKWMDVFMLVTYDII
jgi:hypothetical protein